MGGVPETPKDPPRNFPAGASPSPDWQRSLFSFFANGAPTLSQQQRSSQVVRQRFHTPRTAGSNPASATIFPNAPLMYQLAWRPFTPQKPGPHRHGVPFPNVDHNVIVASGPVKAAVRVQVPLINPTSNRAHGEETNRRSAKPIYPVQVRGARPFQLAP